MHPFLERHAPDVLGALSGFDRLRFRGTLRFIADAGGMGVFLHQTGVLLKHFGEYVDDVTAEVKRATEAVATAAHRPVVYVPRPSDDKEAVGRAIAARDGVTTGLVCTLKSAEPCWSFELHRERATKHLSLVSAWRKCLHYYHYLIDPTLGWLHVRLQSWFPFTVHVGLNGREWLAQRLDAAGLGYQRRDNCFVWLEDVAAAQRLADAQRRTAWAPLRYYWSLEQSEWATDVMFRAAARLDALYPALVAHAMTGLGSRDVMRVLGELVPTTGGVNRRFRARWALTWRCGRRGCG